MQGVSSECLRHLGADVVPHQPERCDDRLAVTNIPSQTEDTATGRAAKLSRFFLMLILMKNYRMFKVLTMLA
jgi:hypothetical protein